MQLNVECTIEHRGNPLSRGEIDMHRLEILSSQAFDRITSSAVFYWAIVGQEAKS